MKIRIDTREQAPYSFDRFGAETLRGTLKTGDYSAEGFGERMAVERKSLDDLIGCLTVGRERFERELERSTQLDFFAVVVESSFLDLANGRYTSKMLPKAAAASVFAFMARYKVPFFFAGSRAAGEYATYSLIEKFVREYPAELGRKTA